MAKAKVLLCDLLEKNDIRIRKPHSTTETYEDASFSAWNEKSIFGRLPSYEQLDGHVIVVDEEEFYENLATIKQTVAAHNEKVLEENRRSAKQFQIAQERGAEQEEFNKKFFKWASGIGAIILVFTLYQCSGDDTSQKSTKSSGNSYEYCSNKCSPALMTCTGKRPESEWSICQKEYNQCTARCK